MMKRVRLLVLSALFAVGLALTPSVRAADGCGQGFTAMDIDDIVRDIAAVGFTREVFKAYDKNDDDILCVRIFDKFPQQNPHFNFNPMFLFLDNPARGQ